MRIILVLSALIALPATAATVMESRNPDGSVATITVESAKARMDMAPGEYMLVNGDSGQHLSVNENNRFIVDMNRYPEPLPASERPEQPKADIEIRAIGSGEAIAGYPTEHYQVSANGEVCIDTYVSKALVEGAALAEFLAGFHRISEKQREAYVAAGTEFDPCDQAQAAIEARYPDIGVPLKTVAGDFVMQEVMEVRLDQSVPKDFFVAPESYEVIDLSTLISGQMGE